MSSTQPVTYIMAPSQEAERLLVEEWCTSTRIDGEGAYASKRHITDFSVILFGGDCSAYVTSGKRSRQRGVEDMRRRWKDRRDQDSEDITVALVV